MVSLNIALKYLFIPNKQTEPTMQTEWQEILFPFSDLNPVEECFNKIKHLFKQAHYMPVIKRNTAVATYDAVEEISFHDIVTYFRNTQCINIWLPRLWLNTSFIHFLGFICTCVLEIVQLLNPKINYSNYGVLQLPGWVHTQIVYTRLEDYLIYLGLLIYLEVGHLFHNSVGFQPC